MENSKCSHPDCELEVYENHDKCVLHCQKDSHYKHKDWSLYKAFNKAFINEIATQLEKASNNDTAIIDKQSAIKILNGEKVENLFDDKFMQDTIINSFNNEIAFDSIVFPQGKSQDRFFYNKAIRKLKAIHFNYCEFNIGYLELDNTQCFFQDCIFHTSWTLPNCAVLNDVVDNVIYQTCTFYSNITNYTPEDNKQLAIYQASQFDYTCQFKQKINFYRAKFEEMLFNTNQSNYLDNNEILEIIFNKCIFEKKFKLNQYNIKKFSCKNSLFKNKFEFRENSFDFFEIINTNFEGICDCNLNQFLNFYMEKNVFNKYIGFEESIFGESTKEKNQVATFKYVSFLDYSYFRKAQFYGGLNLETTNLEEYPNFLDIYVEPKNTNRETFRIIKHSFDKVGNTIEANKFFAYEMDKERENTLLKNNLNKKVILTLNYWISNFGQSWLRPLGLILLVAIFHTLFINAIDKGTFNFIYPSNPIYDFLKGVVDFSNDLAKNILPFKKTLIKGKEFISLVFLIIYSTLLYNFIVAVKRISKR